MIEQHYIPSGENQTIRVRRYNISGHNPYNELCIKFIESNMERDEIECLIGDGQAEDLIKYSIGSVEKRRYKVEFKGMLWEVDLYSKPSGLAIAEVELDSVDQEVDLPNWIIREVTNEPGYSNYELATKEK